MRVVAVSNDRPADVVRFAAEESLPFPLLADPTGDVARRYGVDRGEKARRVSFLIDDRGIVRDVADDIRVSRHGADVVARVLERDTA